MRYSFENLNFSFHGKSNSIVAAVDKFVGYCTSPSLADEIKLKHKFHPIVGLSSFASFSDIENENHGHSYNNMTEFEINQLVSSHNYMWWDSDRKPFTPVTNKVSSNKKITICVCTYNNYDVLKVCLHYLSKEQQNSSTEDYDVLVLDNTSEEKLPPFDDPSFLGIIKKCEYEPNFTYVHEETEGLSGARNRCVELANTDLIHFIDDDSLAHPNFVTDKNIYVPRTG